MKEITSNAVLFLKLETKQTRYKSRRFWLLGQVETNRVKVWYGWMSCAENVYIFLIDSRGSRIKHVLLAVRF